MSMVTKNKQQQQTTYMLVLAILFSLSILVNFISFIITLVAWNFLRELALVPVWYQIAGVVMTVISITLATLFVIKLVKISKQLVLWTHVVFGYYVVLTLANTVYSAIFLGYGLLAIPFSLIGIGAAIVVWITFYKHLLRAKQEKRLLLN